MRNRLVLALLAIVVVAAGATLVPSERAQNPQAGGDTAVVYEAPVDVDTLGLPGPRQPIFFRHDIHAGQYQMECQYCHVNLEVSPKPGIPAMSSCMGCHLIVGTGNPEVEKLRQTYSEQKPIEWVEVHPLAPFVHFPHHRHVLAKIECQECHGTVDRMPQVYQFASLKMGWCLTCHTSGRFAIDGEKRPVTTDCTACHY